MNGTVLLTLITLNFVKVSNEFHANIWIIYMV